MIKNLLQFCFTNLLIYEVTQRIVRFFECDLCFQMSSHQYLGLFYFNFWQETLLSSGKINIILKSF